MPSQCKAFKDKLKNANKNNLLNKGGYGTFYW